VCTLLVSTPHRSATDPLCLFADCATRRDPGEWGAEDRYSTSQEMPTLDKQQDVQLLGQPTVTSAGDTLIFMQRKLVRVAPHRASTCNDFSTPPGISCLSERCAARDAIPCYAPQVYIGSWLLEAWLGGRLGGTV
jgi:hypothetical protein